MWVIILYVVVSYFVVPPILYESFEIKKGGKYFDSNEGFVILSCASPIVFPLLVGIVLPIHLACKWAPPIFLKYCEFINRKLGR